MFVEERKKERAREREREREKAVEIINNLVKKKDWKWEQNMDCVQQPDEIVYRLENSFCERKERKTERKIISLFKTFFCFPRQRPRSLIWIKSNLNSFVLIVLHMKIDELLLPFLV